MLEVSNLISDCAALGLVYASSVRIGPAPEVLGERLALLIKERSDGSFPTDDLRDAVRDMLRSGGFKPSGRSKPASEYLVRAAVQGTFPVINNLVDINNYLSLRSGLPISLLDAIETSRKLSIRFGRDGEKYVFNSAGQEIDLKGLICVCAAEPAPGVPLGTPVKDSMQGKVRPGTTSVLGVIYAPRDRAQRLGLAELTNEFGALLTQYGGAAECETLLV